MNRYLVIVALVLPLLTFFEISQSNLSNAQTSNATATDCEKGVAKGLNCNVKALPYKLEKGKWALFVDGVNGTLNISSVKDDKINATLVGGVMCPESFPCSVGGSFDKQSGKVSFTTHPTLPTLVKIGDKLDQKYTGYLSSQVMGVDNIVHWIIGTGGSAGQEFGWFATIACLINGCP
jgi:hypothetical protein